MFINSYMNFFHRMATMLMPQRLTLLLKTNVLLLLNSPLLVLLQLMGSYAARYVVGPAKTRHIYKNQVDSGKGTFWYLKSRINYTGSYYTSFLVLKVLRYMSFYFCRPDHVCGDMCSLQV